MKRIAAAALLVALAACSKPGGSGGSTAAAPTGAGPSAAAAPASSGSACDRKLISVADVATIMNGTITTGPLPGDPQSCLFKSGDYTVTVSLRPGLGDVTVQTVLSGGENVAATPLPGVGDKAAWTPELHEVNATKNNLLCDIQASGGAGNVTPQTVGALCNKIFAAAG
jgi:hypothetical protein